MKSTSTIIGTILSIILLMAFVACNQTTSSDFSIVVNPTSITLGQTESVTVTVEISRSGGFSEAITLTLASPPTGISGTFNPNPADGDTSELEITVSETASLGPHTLSIQAEAAGKSSSANLSVTVTDSSDFSIVMNPTSITLGQTESDTVTVEISRSGGFSEAITLTLASPPTGISGTFNPNPANSDTSELEITVSETASLGSHTLSIQAEAAGKSSSAELSVTVTEAPESVSQEIQADLGGSLSLGQAELVIPAGALSSDARVTLAKVDPPSDPEEDPLAFVSDAYQVTSEAGVTLNSPVTLGISSDISTQANYQSLLVAQLEPDLPDQMIQLYPSNSEAQVSYEYSVLGSLQWVVAVPILNPIPLEGDVLQVPWYHQSGLPWCVPTSLSAVTRYYDFNEVVDDPLNWNLGQSTALANWQIAAQSDHLAENGANYGQLANIGLDASKTTMYLWDADALISNSSSSQGYYEDFSTYVTLVNTGIYGLFDRRPLALAVDNWWHSIAVVGVDGDGFYYHDSNGPIARYVDWDDFQEQATDWKTDSEGTLIYKDKLFTALIHSVPAKPRAERDGSIVITRGDLTYTMTNGNTARLEWDGDSQHTYGYYFEDPSQEPASDAIDLGFSADSSQPFNYRYRVANVTSSTLTYTTVAKLSGPSYGANVQSRTHVVTVGPYSLSSPIEGEFSEHPPVSSGTGIFSVELQGIHSASLIQDFKFVRYSLINGPEVSILSPSDGATLNYGGLFGVSLEAVATDVEDGDNCCSFSWSTDLDGQIATTQNVDYTFPTPGERVLTVIARDSDGNVGRASINLSVINVPPTVQINQPSAGDTLVTGIPYVFQGEIQDANQPLEQADLCADATWTSSRRGDGSYQGCSPTASFSTPGSRTLTFAATDAYGLRASATVSIDVEEPPPMGPPIVTILSPEDGNALNAFAFHLLSGTATDPDGDTNLSYVWVVLDNGNEIAIGSSESFRWRPDDDLVFNCGGREVDLYLYVTDSDGQTGEDHITVFILFGPC